MGKPKRINFELIDERVSPEPYRILREVRSAHHLGTAMAKIRLAWRKAWKSNPDGRLILGMCVKGTDLQRELAEFDFVILLNREMWNEFDDAKRRALMDHELCHAAPAKDKFGIQRKDERNRLIWRIRKHDIEEFGEIVERHGLYKKDLEAFAEICAKKKESKTLELALR